MKQNRIQAVLGVFCVGFISSLCPADDVSAIHTLLDRMETAYQQHDLALLADQLGENGFLMLSQASDGVRSQSRQQMLEGVARNWQNITSLRIEPRQVDWRGDYAILYMTTVARYQDGRTASQKGIALARKDPNDWKCCFAMERFFSPALLVEELTGPDSAVGKAGVQKGDIILELDGQMPMVSMPGDGAKFTTCDKPTVLTVLRAKEQLRMTVPAGPYGWRVEPRLVGLKQTVFLPDEQPHPSKRLMEEQIRGFYAGDIDRVCKGIDPEAFVGIQPQSGQQSVWLTEKTVRFYFSESIKAVRQMIDISTMKYCNVCTLTCGDIAATSCRLDASTLPAPGKLLSRPSSVCLFGRRDDQWRQVAILPIRVETVAVMSPSAAEK